MLMQEMQTLWKLNSKEEKHKRVEYPLVLCWFWDLSMLTESLSKVAGQD